MKTTNKNNDEHNKLIYLFFNFYHNHIHNLYLSLLLLGATALCEQVAIGSSLMPAIPDVQPSQLGLTLFCCSAGYHIMVILSTTFSSVRATCATNLVIIDFIG